MRWKFWLGMLWGIGGTLAAKGQARVNTDTLLLRGNQHYVAKDYDSASWFYDQVLEQAMLPREVLAVGKATNNLGAIQFQKGHYYSAIQWYERAIRLYDSLGADSLAAQSLVNLGQTYKNLGQIEDAAEAMQRAVGVLESSENRQVLINTYNSIANLLRKDEPTLALAWRQKVLKLKDLFDDRQFGHTYNNLGRDYLALFREDSALYYFKLSLPYKIRDQDTTDICHTYFNLGEVFRALSLWDSAQHYYQAGLDLAREGHRWSIVWECRIGLFQTAQAASDLPQAKRWYELIKLKLPNLSTDLQLRYLTTASAYLEATGQYEEALGTTQSQLVLEKQRAEQQAKQAATRLDRQYKYNRDLLENEKLKTDIERNDAINARQRWALLASVVLILGLGIIMRQQIRLKQQSRRAERIAEKAKLEKEDLYEEMHHRVKNSFAGFAAVLQLELKLHPESETQEVLKENHQRLQALALIHNRLYAGDESGTTQVNFSEYIREVIRQGIHGMMSTPERVRIIEEYVPVQIEALRAMHLGQAVNEAVTNAIKYAFPNHPDPALMVSLTPHGEAPNQFRLVIEDNGNTHSENKQGSQLGMKIIRARSKSADTSWEVFTQGSYRHVWLLKAD